jgi:hypothetical protein
MALISDSFFIFKSMTDCEKSKNSGYFAPILVALFLRPYGYNQYVSE